MRIRYLSLVLMVIMAVALCGCGGFRSGVDKDSSSEQGSQSATNRSGNQLVGVAGDSVLAVVADKNSGLNDSRVVASGVNDRSDYNCRIVDIKEVRELNIYTGIDSAYSRADSAVVYTGGNQSDTGDKEVVGKKAKIIYWCINLILILVGVLIAWGCYEWIKKQFRDVQNQIDCNKDGKLSYDEIKEYVADRVKDMLQKNENKTD